MFYVNMNTNKILIVKRKDKRFSLNNYYIIDIKKNKKKKGLF